MYRINKSASLIAIFPKFLARNLFTTTIGHQSKVELCDKVVFISSTKDVDQLNFKFIYKNHQTNKRKTIQFDRPIDDTIQESVQRMKVKLTKKWSQQQNDSDDIGLRVVDSSSGNEVVQSKWRQIIPNISTFRMNLQNDEYKMVYNYPIIEEIELPKIASVGFDLYPLKLKITGDTSNATFRWYRMKRKGKWTEFENENQYFYRCQESDLNCRIKVVCEIHYDGILTSRIVSNPAEVTERIDTSAIDLRHKYTTKLLGNHHFRVVSYNLLADFYTRTEYSRTELFSYCSPEYLAADYRRKLTRKELLGYNSDVYCLQEVDEIFFEHDLSLAFNETDFQGLYRKKFSTDEGLTTYFNTKKFSLVEDHSIVFSEALQSVDYFTELLKNVKGELAEKLLSLHNSAQILHLKSKSDYNSHLLIVNTHLYSQPDASDIRLLQLCCILQHVKQIMQQYQQIDQFAVIICGDLNSRPLSAVYSLLADGNVSVGQPDLKNQLSLEFSHPHRFQSAYRDAQYTNFTPYFVGVLDYIFYSTDSIDLLKTAPLPEMNVLAENRGIPSDKFPSDHLALVADFQWRNHGIEENSKSISRILIGILDKFRKRHKLSA